ncbi:N-acetylmuramoyl-L-alanine amidase [Metabacillus bambusae]|uniref:N-acetylmuramoyl-L-alanine amidase n=1 Tax=Metabacillus bambusae TaxID=2795218 RepID=A0ABS3N6R2_9BACI|nr:N-acetylmuramoyl-L-alanine amidase [Metabacillus bambusae]MBO1513975.1 N-acetylmuramoyl-L-alanine amidase [Metabacillus bambusae]
MKIMIDAGHGYETPGKRTVDGMKEYEFNRAVANEMKNLFSTYEHVTVQFSHSDKQDVPLSERTAKANQAEADLFVSIHANAHGNGREWTSAVGIETYVYFSKPKAAYELAKIVQANLVKETSRKDRGVKTANFHVLKATRMTAILCECGFMTNKAEAGLLRTIDYRNRCAEAIVKGIVSYFNLKRESKIEKPTHETDFFKVQVGAFTKQENAKKLAEELKSKGYEAIIVTS